MNYQKFFISQIFLLAFPSIVLSSFAIYAILGQKAFILKQVEETYAHLMRGTQTRVVEKLGEKQQEIRIAIQNNSLETFILKNQLYPHFFVLQNEKMVYPTPRKKSFEMATEITEDYSKFKQGHYYEFQKNMYSQAIQEYRNILQHDFTQEKQPRGGLSIIGNSLLAIARCYKKDSDYVKSLDTYNSLIALFLEPKNLQQFKFTTNSKLQIIEIKKYQQDLDQVYENALSLLESLLNNEKRLPHSLYSYYYQKITKTIEEIKDKSSFSIEEKELLLQRYSQILEYHQKKQQTEQLVEEINISLLLNYLAKERKNYGYLTYKINRKPHLFYYQKNFENIVVCKIDPEALKNMLRPILGNQDVANEFFITILDEEKRPIKPVDKKVHIITSQPISMNFSFWSIAIYSKSATSLENLTQQKSYLYFGGVFFIVLLLFMGLYVFVSSFMKEIKNSRLQSDFVSNVTHELKTPLTSIKMFVETLLTNRVADEKEKIQCLTVISAESDRLSRLIDRILDFAKMKERKRNFYFSEEDLGQVITDIVSQFKRKTLDCDVSLSVQEDMPKISLDSEALSEAVMNILFNAYKYTERKDKKIDLFCRQNGKFLEIKIKDNGIGIPRHEQQRIFQKFYRVEDRRASKVEGTGLGLALVSFIVDAHKGRVSVNSKVNIGSEFVISLPIDAGKL